MTNLLDSSYSKFQTEVSYKYGFVGLKLDKLSLTADVTESFYKDILNGTFLLYDYFGIVEPNLTRDGELSSYKGQFFDSNNKENWYIEYTPIASIKMNKRPLKIEFTPSKVSRKNFLQVFHILFSYMKNIAISTFHLAYDFERDLSALRINWPKVMYRPIYKGMKLETMDFGAPKGNYHLTVYDKKKERFDTGDMTEIEIYQSYDNLWRVEYKWFNAGIIKNELKKGLPFLAKIPVYVENFEGLEFNSLGVNEKIYLYVTVEEKGLSEQLEQLENKSIENNYLEKDELNDVLTIVRKHNQQYARILEFQVLTGMRIGEVLGLKSSAISFETGLATIRRTRATHGGASRDDYEGDVKNKQSYRTIKLSSKALLLLQEEIEINQHHIVGNPDYKDSGWIFTSKSSNKSNYNGTPLHYSVINNFLNSSETGKLTTKGHVKRVGINIDNRLSFNKHISTHIFRHTFVSHMAEQGVPLLTVQRYIGHKSGSKVTEEIYTHITKKMSDNITESIDTLID